MVGDKYNMRARRSVRASYEEAKAQGDYRRAQEWKRYYRQLKGWDFQEILREEVREKALGIV